MVRLQYDSVIIGGGFYGLYIAEYLARLGQRVCLCEAEADVMQRASYVNQARVHNGYHYPRNTLTALRSRVLFPKFAHEFQDCIVTEFRNYYLVGKQLSKVTASQFERFCQRIGASLVADPSFLGNRLSRTLVEAVYHAPEYTFNSDRLKTTMLDRLGRTNITLALSTVVLRVSEAAQGLAVLLQSPVGEQQIETRQVFNCTYAGMNRLNAQSNLPLLPLKHELTEICLMQVPESLEHVGLTLMCGPFFSLMPFPARGLHSLTHVRYTPHLAWTDTAAAVYRTARWQPDRSAWKRMRQDVRRYLPSITDCEYRDSLWDLKTVFDFTTKVMMGDLFCLSRITAYGDITVFSAAKSTIFMM
ncbi:MAG: FAD-dependent oxidoreductase [Synechococcaceae cyanobacterium SM2_3_60]|nr:FAD-dependent oxidoreductase [Synechococcaceae cyanobacterium SM2_3_60]